MAELGERSMDTYMWTIENFLIADKEIQSPPISVKLLNDSKWFIRVKSPIPNINGYVSCYLVPADVNIKVSEIICILELLDEDCKSIIKREFHVSPFENCLDVGCERFISFCNLEEALSHSKKDILIIKCRIVGDKVCSSTSGEWIAKTLCEVVSSSFQCFIDESNSTWKIEKQCRLMGYSNKFTLEESEDNIKIEISGGYPSYILTYRVSFLLYNIELFGIRSCNILRNRNCFQIPSIKKSSFFPKSFNKGMVTANFELTAFLGTFSNMVEFIPSDNPVHVNPSPAKDPVTILQEDLRLMFVDQVGCDVKLRVGDDIFSAHKSTLSARSPVFKAMFVQNMVENKTGVVDISDTDAETLNSFLIFCYDATVDKDLDCNKVINLILLADKYQIVSLKETCTAILIAILNDDNVCQVLEVADMIGSEQLKEFSMRIIKNNAQKIFSSNSWSQCVKNNAKLTTEVLQKIILGSYTLK